MFTKKQDSLKKYATDSMEVQNLKHEVAELERDLQSRNDLINRLLDFYGVRENYIGYRDEYPYAIRVPYLNVDRLDADLEAVYAVTKADAARARLTKTEKEDSNAE